MASGSRIPLIRQPRRVSVSDDGRAAARFAGGQGVYSGIETGASPAAGDAPETENSAVVEDSPALGVSAAVEESRVAFSVSGTRASLNANRTIGLPSPAESARATMITRMCRLRDIHSI